MAAAIANHEFEGISCQRTITSAAGVLAQLEEEVLQAAALKQLNVVVDQFWAEIAAELETIEALYEKENFSER